ncbi:Mobile element protein [Cupriavidus sp. U2]|nr:Mobile element protein [Cupriavidus sp. U2]
MRGADTFTESLFTMRRLDDFVPKSHPLRSIRTMANLALAKMDRLFAEMYEADIKGGRPSIAPEKLLRAMLLQVLYSIRSERQLMEQTQYNLLFRWFIGLSMDDTVWVPTVFTKNRARLIQHDAVIEFFNEVLALAQKKNWLSGEHFSVDGTLIQAWAGHKSFVRKDGSDGDDDSGDFRGQQRSNETHQSKTDPDAKLYRKGKTGSELRYMGHTLSDNRHGLVVSALVSTADGDHLSVQVETDAELAEMQTRLVSAQPSMQSQSEMNCCYATLNKHWSVDPTGIAWESFYTLGGAPTFGASRDRSAEAAACCVPVPVTATPKRSTSTTRCAPESGCC